MVIQKDSPKNGEYANVWLPYPADFGAVPEIALEYSGESGRHSNTYPSSGLEKGNPVLKLRISSKQELNDLIAYVNAFKSHQPLPEINANPDYSEGIEQQSSILIDTSKMPIAKPIKPRRQAIPRDVQREVWMVVSVCSVNQRVFFVSIILCLTQKVVVTHSETYNCCAKSVISQREIAYNLILYNIFVFILHSI
jgi:hypothetical protein